MARTAASAADARFDKARRCYVYAGDELPEALLPFAPAAFSWEAWQQNVINGAAQPSYEGSGEIELFAHQQLGVDALLDAHRSGRSGFLVADETGLGKTYQAIAAIHQMPEVKNILVVCPLSVRAAWRKSLRLYGTGGKSWCVQNIHGMKNLVGIPKSAAKAKRTRTKNNRIANEGTALERWDVVVFDESAAYRNPTTQRSKLARRLGADAFRIWVSATAGQTPLELSYLAPLLAEVTGREVKNLEQFAAWCADIGIGVTRGEYGKWEWAPNPGDLSLMRQLLFDPDAGGIRAGIRRRPSDIAGWPEQLRISTPIELDADGRRLYAELWTEFRRELNLAQRGKNPAGGLAALTRFRQKASLLRVEGVAGLIQDLRADGLQVAVSVHWHESMHELAAALKGNVALMHGRQSETERESSREAFQRGDVDVILFTPTEGFSLHATEDIANGIPRATVIHDVRWTALEARQIEGRCHRSGERADVHYTYAEDTVEEYVLERCLQRIISMGGMQGDDVDEVVEMLDAMEQYASSAR